MSASQIARISMPNEDEFFGRYVFQQEPVVIEGLFAGQEIAQIRTVDDASTAWGVVPLEVQEEYASAEGTAPPAQPLVLPLRDYIAFTDANPTTRLCCTEYETPARVVASFRLPAVCRVPSSTDEEIFGLPRKYGDFDLVTNTFIASAGNVAHLHFDGDQRHVLLHQVYGRKRVVLFPPASAIHLRTLDGPATRPSLAGLSLERLSLDERLALVERIGGHHTVLEPGETLFIPMLMWHHVEYLDHAMSFNLRFGRSHIGRFLSLDNFHRDPYIQNVASTMVGPDDVLRGFDPVIEEIKDAYLRPAADLRDKVRQVRETFRRLCIRLCPDASAPLLCPPEREEEQISRIVESNDLRGGLKYADPSVIARTRPVGPITSRQLAIIGDRVRSCGYSEDVERAVIQSRTGKGDVGELTRAEAAQMIDYLTTPGATW